MAKKFLEKSDQRYLVPEKIKMISITNWGEKRVVDFSPSGLLLESKTYFPELTHLKCSSFLINKEPILVNDSIFPIDLVVRWVKTQSKEKFLVGVHIANLNSISRTFLFDVFTDFFEIEKDQIQNHHLSF